MASIKERERWERWYDEVNQRVQNQKRAIDRLLAFNTEAGAALMEIAAWKDSPQADAREAARRAQEALDRIAEGAAAVRAEREESEANPITDPRRKQA